MKSFGRWVSMVVGVGSLASLAACAGGPPTGEQVLTIDKNAYINSVAVHEDRSVVVIGSEFTPDHGRDIFLARFDDHGRQLWLRTLDGAAHEDDYGVAVTISHGSIYVTGSLSTSHANMDIWVSKFSMGGNQLWAETFAGAGNDNDLGYGIVVDHQGNVLVDGVVRPGDQYNNIWLRKYSPSGVTLWTRTYNGAANLSDSAHGIAVDSADNVIVSGYEMTAGMNSNVWLRKYDPDGNEVWTRTEEGSGSAADSAIGVVVGRNDTIFTTGHETDASGNSQIWLSRYASDGTQGFRVLAGEGGGSGIALNEMGDLFVTGYSGPYPAAPSLWVARYDEAGNQLWNRTIPGQTSSQGFGIAVDGDDEIAVGGYTGMLGGQMHPWLGRLEQ